MAQSTTLPARAPGLASTAALGRSGIVTRSAALSAWPIGCPGRVAAVGVGGREEAFLRAVALVDGEIITVLRRAGFGGPLHVRVESGAEFAIDRTLSDAITIEPADAEVEAERGTELRETGS